MSDKNDAVLPTSPTNIPKSKWTGPTMSPRKMIKLLGKPLSPRKSPKKKMISTIKPPTLVEDELEQSFSHQSISPKDLLGKEETVLKSPSEIQAENLLSEIRKALEYQQGRAKKYDQEIQDQKERAALLIMMGTEAERDECAEKIESLKVEREKVHSAISLLSLHLISMQSDLEEAISLAASQNAGMEHSELDHSQVKIEFSEHESYAQEVDEVLE